jgi:hypothetical protein
MNKFFVLPFPEHNKGVRDVCKELWHSSFEDTPLNNHPLDVYHTAISVMGDRQFVSDTLFYNALIALACLIYSHENDSDPRCKYLVQSILGYSRNESKIARLVFVNAIKNGTI